MLNAYAILYAAFLVPAGRFADRYGRKGGFVERLTARWESLSSELADVKQKLAGIS